jgi:hypothetical protein
VAGFLGRGRVKPGHKTVLDYVIMYTHTKLRVRESRLPPSLRVS